MSDPQLSSVVWETAPHKLRLLLVCWQEDSQTVVLRRPLGIIELLELAADVPVPPPVGILTFLGAVTDPIGTAARDTFIATPGALDVDFGLEFAELRQDWYAAFV